MQRSEAPTSPERSRHLHRFGSQPRAAPGAPAKALLAGTVAVGLCGIPVVALLPIGPLSAHMVHHVALMNVLAPLCAVTVAPLAQDRLRTGRRALLWTAAGVQMVLLWAWHAPSLHAAAASGAAYAAVLSSLFVAALCFWGGVLLLPGRSHWQAIVALLATGKLACLLGALLIFAPRPLYSHAAGQAAAHNLQDQQLAGLLMIVACPLSYVLVGVLLSAQLMYGLVAQTGTSAQPNVPASR